MAAADDRSDSASAWRVRPRSGVLLAYGVHAQPNAGAYREPLVSPAIGEPTEASDTHYGLGEDALEGDEDAAAGTARGGRGGQATVASGRGAGYVRKCTCESPSVPHQGLE